MEHLGVVTGADAATREEWHALVQRIVASSVFEKSTRLRNFLLYVSERTLDNHPEDVNEQFIGQCVFDRPIGYNPADDNIVRVSARQLRSKLREYFETDGCGESCVLEIPKGSYLPVFHNREPQGAPNMDRMAAPHARPSTPIWARTISLGTIAALSILLTVWLWNRHEAFPGREASAASQNFLTAFFGHQPASTQVILSDSGLVLMQALAGHQFSLQEYANGSYLRPPARLSNEPGMGSFWDFLGTRQLSNIGDIGAANRIFMSLPGHESKVIIRNSRHMRARDFKTGNFILLGSAYSNPWTQLFSQDELSFRFAGDEPGGPREIRNLHPRPGERDVYLPEKGPDKDGVGYARIVLVPNLTNTGRVLQIAGISMESTEAAADYLLGPSSTQEVLGILGVVSMNTVSDFELLLETTAVEGTPKSARVIAHRVYPQPPKTN